ncbi:Major pollen allergen Bet v 1-M/N [Sesamum alatum]|uniref:Major pollen allergen Bet v 1-M/N n=1 Tax=Sesamum alatum TaxID=300844 RepID=A0AAE2CKV8_9LAMI|nr:Major pollen allergen Bet v 1-M/N [Sesamum alatum]
MGVLTFEDEVVCSIPPAKLFKALILDGDNLIPKLLPHAFKSFENLEGDGGPGTVKLVTFAEGSPYKTAKHRIDEIDEENHVFKYSVIGGEALGEDFESMTHVFKIEAGPDGGCVCKTSSTFHTKGDHDHVLEEKIKAGKERGKAIFKAVEAHLHAHPHEYN